MSVLLWSALSFTGFFSTLFPAGREETLETRDEFRHGPADIVGAVFLNEMQRLDGNLGLVGPGSAEFALWADQDRARIGVDKEFRQIGLGQPCGIFRDERDHLFRFPLNGDLERPRQGGAAVFPGVAEGAY